MSTPRHDADDDALDLLRVEVAVVPASSKYAALVREVAARAGAAFVPVDLAVPYDVVGRLLVVDLTQVMVTRRLGRQVIAISTRDDLDCYDVIHPDQVQDRLRRALTNLIEVQQHRARLQKERETIRVLNELGFSLSAITDTSQLLDRLLSHARRALRADGGSIYLVADGVMRFAASQNDTIRFEPTRATLPVDDSSMAGFAALNGELLRHDDLRAIGPELPYRPNFVNDQRLRYETRSSLLVPMFDRDNAVFGVLAFYNRKSEPGAPLASFDRVLPFTEHDADLARSIASQASVALENHRLYQEIRDLFDGFVTAAVTVIEARDPSTAGHSHRVARLTSRIAQEVHDSDEREFAGVRFTPVELEELYYASILHDFGKVGVPEHVLLKADKLHPWELERVEGRFRVAALQTRLESMRAEGGEPLEGLLTELERDLSLVRRMNRTGYRYTADDVAALNHISGRWWLTDQPGPVVTALECARLCIPQGSLDPEERRSIEAHVSFTYNFLKVIPWTRNLKRVPELAHAHHEKLDGTGYPLRLSGDQIPYGARLMTIADIFDALTAGDRPYKGSMAIEQATRILRAEVDAGHIEGPAVELFIGKRLWEGIVGARAPEGLLGPGRHDHGAHPHEDPPPSARER
ncbi:GAF domain-containing protein [Myxococcota bacterium]|nr:GAF domain-containing protein [Myxococcota bacterium]